MFKAVVILVLIVGWAGRGSAAETPAQPTVLPAATQPTQPGSIPATQPAEATTIQIPIDAVPEMKAVPETSWAAADSKDPAAVMAPALLAWNQARPAVEKKLTPELVRSLSQWAVPQMAGYQKVPALDHVRFELAGESKDGRQILLEATLDTLPSHSPLVTRWLKLYLICDKATGGIARAIVTIRGQVLE